MTRLSVVYIDNVQEKLFQFRERSEGERFGKMKVCASIIFFSLATILVVSGKVLSVKDPEKYINCAKNKVLWPDYGDKRNYFECVGDDYFVKRSCRNKTVFNYKTQECTWPEDWIKPPESDNLVEREFSPTCSVFELHLFWPDPENPQDYFRCTGIGEYVRLTCPIDRVFNFLVQICVALETTTTTEIPSDRFPDCFENELHLTWPDPWYPENFFVCTGIGEFELRGCPPGRFFVFMLQMCFTEDETPSMFPTESTRETLDYDSTMTEKSTIPSTTTTIFPSTTTMSTTTEGLQTAPTIFYPKLTCVICWRPTCEQNEIHLKWPDYDNERNYFQCLSEGVLTLKPCGWSEGVFDFKEQKCVEVDNQV
jgi:Chitin binding Peritrophin-A domain